MATSQVLQLPAEPHVALVRCQTNYLGAAAPFDVRDGLEAVQKPLAELVCAAGRVLGPPFDAVLTAYTSGVSVESPPNANHPVFITKWWPISDLLECGAFRWDGVLFQPVKYSPTVPVVGGQPTLFAMTFRRRDIPASDCWAFVTKTEEAAIALTTAVKLAHLNRLGWGSSPTDRPPALNLDPLPPSKNTQRSAPTCSSMFQASCGRSQSSCWNATADNDCGTFINSKLGNVGQIYNEFNEKPPLRGYFYTPNSSLIKTYSISSEQPCCAVNDAAPTQQLLSASTEPKVSAQPLITGPYGPNYTNLDRYYGEQTAAGVRADVVRPTTSWPLFQDAQPQLPQPQRPQPPQQPQLQALPAPYVDYPVPVAYPEYFPAYPPPIPPPIYQPDETVEFVSRVIKKKHHKHPGYYDDDDDDDAFSIGRNDGRYVLVPEEALRLRGVARTDPAGSALPVGPYIPGSQPVGIGPPPSNRMNQLPTQMVDPYADEGLYERRLPVGGPLAAGRMIAAYDDPYYDPDMMYGSNFILKPADGIMMRPA